MKLFKITRNKFEINIEILFGSINSISLNKRCYLFLARVWYNHVLLTGLFFTNQISSLQKIDGPFRKIACKSLLLTVETDIPETTREINEQTFMEFSFISYEPIKNDATSSFINENLSHIKSFKNKYQLFA